MKSQGKYGETQVLETPRLEIGTNSVQLICKQCLQSFSNVNEFEKHVAKHKNLNIRVCMYCGKEAQSIKEMREHVALHGRRVVVYPCVLCDSVFQASSAKEKHMLAHTLKTENLKQEHSIITEIDLKTENIKQENSIITEPDLPVYETEHSPLKKISFNRPAILPLRQPMNQRKSKLQFITVKGLKDKNAIFKMDGVICSHCGLTFADEDTLNNHLKLKVGKGAQCWLCPEILPNVCASKVHLQFKHDMDKDCGVGLYQCSMCSAAFTSRNALQSHKVDHADIMIPCEDCGALFAGRSGLYLHRRRVHDNRRDFVCQHCGKSFVLKSQKDTHERIHTNERPFVCGICGAKFKAQSGLIIHRRTHTDERPFECNMCGKRLRLGYNLKLHLRTHTGEKPYECEICGKRFTQPGDRKKHIKVHGRLQSVKP